MPEVRERSLRRILLVLLITIASIYLINLAWSALQFFSGVIMLFFVAWLIAFILNPTANWLQDRGLPRIWAVVLVYLFLAVIMTATIILLIPVIADEVTQVTVRLTTLSTPDNIAALDNQAVSWLRTLGISDDQAHATVSQMIGNLQTAIQTNANAAADNAASSLSSLAGTFLNTVIVLILSFYMMLDGRRILNGLIRRMPIAWRPTVEEYEDHVAAIFGGFLRSQLIIGFSYGLLTFIALLGLGIPNGIVISLIAGLIMIIPFAGPFLALIPPMALILLETPINDVASKELVLVIALFISQQIVMQVLAPRIMSSNVGLHPLWLFAALLIGAKEAGIWGAFFAAPVAALIAVILREALDEWAQHHPEMMREPKAKPLVPLADSSPATAQPPPAVEGE